MKQGSQVTVECLLSVAGDLTDASVGQLPRDKKQETNMRREAEGVMWAEFRTPKTPQAPYDMCIKYQERLVAMYVFQYSVTPQSKFGNAYYHCQLHWMQH